MDAAPPPRDRLKTMLRSAVQSVQWTYILFWQFSPQQRVLVWGDGYYNGSIRTRKTVQPTEVSTEEAALSRSDQLKELYDSLAAGDYYMTGHHQPPTPRRPTAALSPEDLTESEWFYLMCVSFTFPPGVGLVGRTYIKQQYAWLTSVNNIESKVFTRNLLAKSADLQTVTCIPILNGVVELGTTELVKDSFDLVQHITSFFIVDDNNPIPLASKPVLSSHSSNTHFSPQFPITIYKPLDNSCQIDEELHLDNDEDDEENSNENDDVDENYNRSGS